MALAVALVSTTSSTSVASAPSISAVIKLKRRVSLIAKCVRVALEDSLAIFPHLSELSLFVFLREVCRRANRVKKVICIISFWLLCYFRLLDRLSYLPVAEVEVIFQFFLKLCVRSLVNEPSVATLVVLAASSLATHLSTRLLLLLPLRSFHWLGVLWFFFLGCNLCRNDGWILLNERLRLDGLVRLLDNLKILDVVDLKDHNWVLLFRRVHLVDSSTTTFSAIAPYILELHRPLSLVDLNKRSFVPDLGIRNQLEQGANQLVLLLGRLLSFCLVRSFRHFKLIINNINQPKNI